MPDFPTKLNQKTIAQGKLFRLDSVDLEFSNGERRTFEMIVGDSRGSVVVVPMPDDNTIMFLEEYAVGTERYEYGFVKGLIDGSETPEQAAQRELAEEAGYHADEMILLDTVSTMPGYSDFKSHIFLARKLAPRKAIGDEPESLIQHRVPLDNVRDTIKSARVSDVRTRLALYLVQDYLHTNTTDL